MGKRKREAAAAPAATPQSEELLRVFVEHTPAAVAMLDREMRYVVVSRRWCTDFRVGELSVIGRSHYDVFPEIPERWKEVHRRCLAGATERCDEDSFVRADGVIDWVRWEIVPWHDASGAVGGIIIFSEVITDRVRTEEKLRKEVEARRRSEEEAAAQRTFLRRVIDADPHLVFAKDWDGRFTLVNQAVADIYGTTVDELTGKCDADFNPNAQEVENFLRDDREVMASLAPKFIPEEPVTDARTGVTRWFQTIKVPLVGPGGVARQVLGIATDITQRRQLEEQFRQAQKMEAVGRLAGGIAHDFNNLLTAISGYAALLLRGLPSSDTRHADLAEIKSAANRATSLTRQLLAFSRRQVLRPEVLDLNATVSSMNTLIRRVIGEDIELREVLDPALGAVKADRGQIEQVLLNLAVNARDAMPQGGRLTLETRNVDAAEASSQEAPPGGRCVLLAMSDTGCGMSAETKSHLFEPFFTTKGAGKGTGLGLATVYGIVKQSAGNITVYSEEGKGTSFKIYLPRVNEAATRASEPTPEPKDLRGAETVLVVEDAEAVRNLATRLLGELGYRVLSAADASAAIEVARAEKGRIHLVLTDVVLPGMNGRELVSLLAAQQEGLKAIFMSGYTYDAVAHHGVLDPGVAFLQKPFAPNALARTVREVLNEA